MSHLLRIKMNCLKNNHIPFTLLLFTFLFFALIKIQYVSSESIYGQVKWIQFNDFDKNQQTPSGFEKSKQLIYTSRTKSDVAEGLLCGKYNSVFKQNYFTFDRGVKSNEVEMLSYPRGTISWVAATKNHLPADILACGGQGAFPCRAWHNGDLIPGRVEGGGECVVTDMFKLVYKKDYEVPVVNFMARALGSWPASKSMLHYRTERSEKYNYTKT